MSRFSGPAARLPAAVRLLSHRRPVGAASALELPGVDPAAVRIVAAGTALVVSGIRERPHPAGARYRQVEIEYGPFERRIELAEDVDADARDGYLRGRDVAARGAAQTR